MQLVPHDSDPEIGFTVLLDPVYFSKRLSVQKPVEVQLGQFSFGIDN